MNTPLHPLEIRAENEQENIAEVLRLTIEKMRNVTAAEDNIAGKPSLVTRDAHAKGHGCYHATFTVNSNLPKNIPAVGVFKNLGQEYKALVRFSSGAGQLLSDKKMDGRGMGVKVFGVDGSKCLPENVLSKTGDRETQDFLMIKFPAFFVKNAEDYLAFTQNSASFFKNNLRESMNAFRISFGGYLVKNPLYSKYSSMVPYALSEDRAMKYRVVPETELRYFNPFRKDSYLHGNALATLKERGVTFDFQIQLRTGNESEMPIEDPTIRWPEKKGGSNNSMYQSVAKIHIPQQQTDDTGEILSFNPWHCNPELRPIGGIGRVRKVIYQEIYKHRFRENVQRGYFKDNSEQNEGQRAEKEPLSDLEEMSE